MIRFTHIRFEDPRGNQLSSKGGITLAYTVRDGKMYVGASFTSAKDNFVKAKGRDLATARLNKAIEDGKNGTYHRIADLDQFKESVTYKHYSSLLPATLNLPILKQGNAKVKELYDAYAQIKEEILPNATLDDIRASVLTSFARELFAEDMRVYSVKQNPFK